MKIQILSYSFVLAILLAASTGYAQEDLQWEIVNRVLHGKDKPTITLSTGKSIKSAVLKVTRNDKRAETLNFGSIKAGGSKKVTLKAGLGRWQYEGTLHLKYRNGTGGELPVSFDVVVAGPLGMEAPYERMRLGEGHIEVKLGRAADRCQYTVWTEGNSPIQGELEFAGAPAGDWLLVDWSTFTHADVVLKIVIECYDTDGFSNGLELSPWKIEVPHEDVNFATGKSAIDGFEYPKVKEAVDQIKTTLRRYSDVLKVQVFVSGHTDTVGDDGYNKTLSEKRARAIATAFRKAGIRVPIYFVGYGEDKQAVTTADEASESRNRRARYIMAVHPPETAQWKKL
jgi:outer membrane protein OmpA-like peptidoglycan-associated protein